MGLRKSLSIALLSISCSAEIASQAQAHVEVNGAQLVIDGKSQPQLFGAEIQYFRLRGGTGRNVPRERVIDLWAKALDRAVEAKMNAVSFYIPWDFHEYAEGKFDFDGTADEDGDGRPDYPSRDVKTFIRMVEERGIHHIMVRPGPYINAEWGFLGFGAIPVWFHQKYPDSHMRSPEGYRTFLYDYHNPDFLKHTRMWFESVYREVLKDHVGPGRPIDFLQIDNETNFMWSSIYRHDYGAPNVQRYHDYLTAHYSSLSELNQHHGRNWKSWSEIQPPTVPGLNLAEDQDWYRFEDASLYNYLGEIRKMWEDIGIREPTVIFTAADSYNAPDHGLLPNYKFRDKTTSLLTVNLYPKTEETTAHPFLNNPFKTDADVLSADAASQYYFGNGNHWVMGPEVQGGWWKGIPVLPAARQQTYLSVLGHGMKGLFVYYFNEGDNWQWDWSAKQLQPFYDRIRAKEPYASLPEDQLPEAFWHELQQTVDSQFLAGWDVHNIMRERNGITLHSHLFFDAPLDENAQPRQHFFDLKRIGEKIVAPHAHWLGRAVAETEQVCIVKDDGQNVPSSIASLNSVSMESDWHAGLVGALLQAGANPETILWDLNGPQKIKDCRIVFHQDNGVASDGLGAQLKTMLEEGSTVVNIMGDGLASELGVEMNGVRSSSAAIAAVNYHGSAFGVSADPLFEYTLAPESGCSPLLTSGQDVRGYKCALGKGSFYQVGVLFYKEFNSNDYTHMTDSAGRAGFLRDLLHQAGIKPAVEVLGANDRVVAFSRAVPGQKHHWVTVKSGRLEPVQVHIRVRDVSQHLKYRVRDLLSSQQWTISGAALQRAGFPANLASLGSTVFWIEPAQGL